MPESGVKDKIQNIINKYEDRLASVGVKITVSKRYFEVDVTERNTYHPVAGMRLLNYIDRYFDKKRERKYKNERNKYHCIVLSVIPIAKNLVCREYCKDYAFVLRKVERAHIGQEPQKIQYGETKVLSRIERRILKILKAAEKHLAETVCKDTWFDAIRYLAPKYSYKEKVLGKELATWELAFMLTVGVLAIILVLFTWIISSLI